MSILKVLKFSFLMVVTTTIVVKPDPFENISNYSRENYSRSVTQCDLLAAHSDDHERVSSGISEKDMDKPAAILACLNAVKKDDENPRLNYQLARAYAYSGLHEESDQYQFKALNAGYPQSLFVTGYIRLEGWDGRKADPCYGGELIRRSAVAGRFSGLVGFPHYVQTGRFDSCKEYPLIKEDEISGFLDKAENETSDYYHLILIENLKAGLKNN